MARDVIPIRLATGTLDQQLYAVLIRPGQANELFFSEALLQAEADKFNRAPVFIDHAGPRDWLRPGGRSVRDLAGMVQNARWSLSERAIVGNVALLPQAAWVLDLARSTPPLPRFGLSADMHVLREGKEVLAIQTVHSVDIVVNPAAGGCFLSGGAAGKAPPHNHHQERSGMTCASEERIQQAEPLAHQGGSVEGGVTRAPAPGGQEVSPAATHESAALDAAGQALPQRLAETLRSALRADGSLTPQQTSALMDAWRRSLAEAQAQASIVGLGQATQVRAPLERVTLAFEALMGLGDTAAHRSAPRLSGIRELYDLLTGDYERHGLFRAERVTLANASTSTMVNVVADVLNKALLRAYEARAKWWAPIVHEEDFASMRDVKWITVGGFSNLDTVDEGDPYTEKTWEDNAEVGAFVKKGNYIGISMEMIDRDDVAAVRAIPRKLAFAAQRTLSAAVAELFTANGGVGPTLSDEEALFDAEAHHNLGTAALSAEEWDAVIQAMFKQTELHSARRLGIRPRYCLVPIELEKVALEIFTTDVLDPSEAVLRPNVRRMADSVITVPEWTDDANWAAAADPADLEGVCIGYRYGRAPEIFVADSQVMGSMFTNDEMRIKCRFVYSVGIGDYRALYKENVAG